MIPLGYPKRSRNIKMVVGLGNPGPPYANTRHNVGFAVIERLAAKLNAPNPRRLHSALVSEIQVGEQTLVLVQPMTFMNRSGQAVRPLLDAFGLTLDDLLVVYDDVALPLGTLRIRRKGSAGGHNGMKSVIGSLNSEEFARLRIGVGSPDEGDLADYVLSPFRLSERPLVDAAIEAAAEAVLLWVNSGVEAAMNRFNGWTAAGEVAAGEVVRDGRGADQPTDEPGPQQT